MVSTNIKNIYLKQISMKELKDISKSVLKNRREQFLGHMGLIDLEAFKPQENIKVKDNFVFEIQKLFGFTKKALNIINNFPFKELLIDLRRADWDKNTQKEKATFFYHFIITQKPPEDREQILEAIVKSFGENPSEFTPELIDSVAVKEIPATYYREQPEVEPERKQGTELAEIERPEILWDKSFETAIEHPRGGVIEEIVPDKKYNINYSETKKPISVNIVDGHIRNKALFERLSQLAGKYFEIASFLSRYPYAKSIQETRKQTGSGLRKKGKKKGGEMVGIDMVKNFSEMKPAEMINELAILLGSKIAGNTGVSKDISTLLKHMKKMKVISSNEFKKFMLI
jgi:hypothetical protein